MGKHPLPAPAIDKLDCSNSYAYPGPSSTLRTCCSFQWCCTLRAIGRILPASIVCLLLFEVVKRSRASALPLRPYIHLVGTASRCRCCCGYLYCFNCPSLAAGPSILCPHAIAHHASATGHAKATNSMIPLCSLRLSKSHTPPV
jgi:hypothetical protein